MTETETFAPASARVAAGALFLDPTGRVLLVKPTYKDGWDIPGGYVEPGEAPRAACIREVTEELGITPPIGDLLVVDWAPHPTDGDKILFVFDGGTLTDTHHAAIRLDDREIAQYAYAETSQLPEALPERLANRVGAAIAAYHAGRPSYLEHGQTPGQAANSAE